MQVVRREDVPEYLQKGRVFRTCVWDEEEVEVPTDCLKGDTVVQSEEDLVSVLKSIVFWDIKEVPISATEFIFAYPSCLRADS